MAVDECVVQKILENWLHDSLVFETEGGERR